MTFSDPKAHTFTSSGCRINVKRWENARPSDVARGKVALLVHGFLAHAGWWDHIAPELTSFQTVLAIDMSGMGDSEHREVYDVQMHVEEISDCLNFMNITGKASLIGHSFGGSIALTFASQQPDRLAELVVLDSPLRVKPKPYKPVRDFSGRSYADVDEALKRYKLLPPQPFVRPEIVDRVARASLKTLPDGRVAWKFDHRRPMASQSASDMWNASLARFKSLQIPKRLIRGEHSALFPDDLVAALKIELPNDPIETIAGAHHHVLLDQPERLIAALSRESTT